MESEEERERRRAEALDKYRNASVPPNEIKKKTTSKVTLGNAQQRKVEQKKILDGLKKCNSIDPDICKYNPDHWVCITDALKERDLHYSELKIRHPDLFLKKKDLLECIDDTGVKYEIKEDVML